MKWLPVVGYEGWYEVSDMGDIKRMKTPLGNVPFTSILRQTSLCPSKNPAYGSYRRISLSVSTIRKAHFVHRLVAEAFIGPCPAGQEVNHKNGIRDDNRPENLEYVSRSENLLHSFANLKPDKLFGTRCRFAKLKAVDIPRIKLLRSWGLTYKDIAADFGVSLQAIHYICAGKHWKCAS